MVMGIADLLGWIFLDAVSEEMRAPEDTVIKVDAREGSSPSRTGNSGSVTPGN